MCVSLRRDDDLRSEAKAKTNSEGGIFTILANGYGVTGGMVRRRKMSLDKGLSPLWVHGTLTADDIKASTAI